MTKKCDKYESLFVFSDEESFLNHVSQCDDCKLEHEKMLKVSDLIKEVKTTLRKQKANKIKVACVVFIMMVGGLSINVADQQYGVLDKFKYGERLTLSDMGIPTDNYGLIMVD